MRLTLPPALSSHEDHLRSFFEAMIFKLNVNAYKDDIRDKDVPGLLDLMAKEVLEFKDQLAEDEQSPNNLMELADTGNFAYLLYRYLRLKGYLDPKERFIREYMDVTEDGRIICKRSRSGSRYSPGDEIAGTVRNGQVFIRMQQSETGASVSMSRASVVWWFNTNKWPTGGLAHKDGNTLNDRFSNLKPVETSSEAVYPFVTCWQPKGRESDSNWGRFVYQRRHGGVLIKSGYYDTPEQAARDGLAEWKEKTRV